MAMNNSTSQFLGNLNRTTSVANGQYLTPTAARIYQETMDNLPQNALMDLGGVPAPSVDSFAPEPYYGANQTQMAGVYSGPENTPTKAPAPKKKHGCGLGHKPKPAPKPSLLTQLIDLLLQLLKGLLGAKTEPTKKDAPKT